MTQPNEEAIRKEQQIVRRLASALARCDLLLERAAAEDPYHLVLVPADGKATHSEFSTRQELIEALSPHRGSESQAFVFRGRRLRIAKGPAWALLEGDEATPLSPSPVDEHVDADGYMTEAPSLEELAGSRDDGDDQEPVDDDAEEWSNEPG